jgi:hypothetical protein
MRGIAGVRFTALLHVNARGKLHTPHQHIRPAVGALLNVEVPPVQLTSADRQSERLVSGVRL